MFIYFSERKIGSKNPQLAAVRQVSGDFFERIPLSSLFLLPIFALRKIGANGWSRTADHRVMSPVLYR